jgi:hypothetical protein
LSEEEEFAEEVEEAQIWKNHEARELKLVHEDTLWNVYHGINLEESFGSFDEAEEYLLSEGFRIFNMMKIRKLKRDEQLLGN